MLNLPENLIMNCTGFGSYHLFNDKNLVPIKGNLLYIEKVKVLS